MGSIVGKEYKNKATNERIKVSEIDGNIAILENDQRIAIERLLDSRFYVEAQYGSHMNSNENKQNNMSSDQITESINNVQNSNVYSDTPSLDTSSFHKSLLRDIQQGVSNHNNDGGNYNESDGGVGISVIDPVDEDDDPNRSVIESSRPSRNESKEQEMIQRHMEQQKKALADSKRQKSSIKNKLKLEDDDEYVPYENKNLDGATFDGKPIDEDRDVSVSMKDENDREIYRNDRQNNHVQQANKSIQKVTNPMFEKMKRSKKHTLKIEIEELLPAKDLLKMLEEGFEDSVLDYLTDEVASKVFSNVDIKEKIKEQLKEYVYGKPKAKRKTTAKKTTAKKPTTNSTKGKDKSDVDADGNKENSDTNSK